MQVALIDSGLGLTPTATWLASLRPGLDLLLCLDPDTAPWGPQSAQAVTERVFLGVEAALDRGCVAVVLPCNTASVVSLDAVRDRLEPDIPVIGTVPAIKPAARDHATFAVWATATTTVSEYQRGLITEFADGRTVYPVACHGLAEAIDWGDDPAIDAAITDAWRRTPDSCTAIVLGCTHYPLVGDRILAHRRIELVDSAAAVARQTLRRLEEAGLPADEPGRTGRVEVVLSGRPGPLPDSLRHYPQGRQLLSLHSPARDSVAQHRPAQVLSAGPTPSRDPGVSPS